MEAAKSILIAYTLQFSLAAMALLMVPILRLQTRYSAFKMAVTPDQRRKLYPVLENANFKNFLWIAFAVLLLLPRFQARHTPVREILEVFPIPLLLVFYLVRFVRSCGLLCRTETLELATRRYVRCILVESGIACAFATLVTAIGFLPFLTAVHFTIYQTSQR